MGAIVTQGQMLPAEEFENARKLAQRLQLGFAHELNAVYK